MEENTVNTVETTEKAAKTDQKTAKKEKKPSFFKGLKTEYKKIVFADKETVAKQFDIAGRLSDEIDSALDEIETAEVKVD